MHRRSDSGHASNAYLSRIVPARWEGSLDGSDRRAGLSPSDSRSGFRSDRRCRLIASQLFNVEPWDPRVMLVATPLLILAALISAMIPAPRATQVDPMIALRHE